MQSSVLEVEPRLSIEHSARKDTDVRIKMKLAIPDKFSFFSFATPFQVKH